MAFPPFQLKTLANGLQVLVIPQHEEPSISFRLMIKAGPAQDPSGKSGLASFLSTLLDQGTTTKSSEGIADTVESAGGSLSEGTGSEITFVNASVLKDRFNELLDLTSDIVQHPAFAAQEIERQRAQALSGMQVNADDAGYIADTLIDRLVFGAHPYGQPGNGTPETIKSFTREDLVAFHKAWFAPNNAMLAIVGDVASADEAFTAAERAFGTWAKHDVPVLTLPDPPDPVARVVVIDKPGSVQTEVRVGQLGVPRTHTDFTAIDLAIRILGGEGGNRLFSVLRTERGLTYGASADMEALRLAGEFVAETNTKSETTADALRITVDEFWRLQREPVDRRELKGAQDYLAGSFPLTIETPGQIASQVLNRLFYGLDLKGLETYRDEVQAVTVEDVYRVSHEFLKPDRLSIVLVGNASAFVPQLKAKGFSNIDQIAVADLDITSPTLRRGGTSAPTADTGDTSKAALVLAKAVQAKGGLARLKAVQTVDAQASVTVVGAGGPLTMTVRSIVAYPDRVRVDVDAPSGHVVQVSTPQGAWVVNATGVADATDDQRDEMAASLARDVLTLLIGASDGRIPVRALPDEQLAGSAVAALELTPAVGRPVTMFVDLATGDVRGVRFSTLIRENSPLALETYDDFRDVDGVRLPFHTRTSRDGAVIDRRVSSVHVNGPVAADAFARGK